MLRREGCFGSLSVRQYRSVASAVWMSCGARQNGQSLRRRAGLAGARGSLFGGRCRRSLRRQAGRGGKLREELDASAFGTLALR
jgi:hypothetical protein